MPFETPGVMVASRQRRELSHFSMLSPGEYRMGVSSLISRNDRALAGTPASAAFFDLARAVEVDVDVEASLDPPASLVRDGRVDSRSCWMSLRERERPVPS